nr:hypothetical protein [uncultured Sphingomonas sp.]
MTGKLVLRGGKRPKLVTGRPSTWTKAMAQQFIEVLSETCNVGIAARAIGRSISNVYKQRTKDAAFRAAWDQAIVVAFGKLEMMMLERALHGSEKLVVARDGTSTIMREYNDRVALALLRMHRDTAREADTPIDHEDYNEACERIMARLERIKPGDEGAASEPAMPETKSMMRGADLVLAIWRHRQ